MGDSWLASLTFSHPSIFSLFLSLLLGLESTLIREPRESAWLPDATAKDEKAGGREVEECQCSHRHICILFPETDRQLHKSTTHTHTQTHLWWSWALLWKRRHLLSCRDGWQKSLPLPHWGRLGSPGITRVIRFMRTCYLLILIVD